MKKTNTIRSGLQRIARQEARIAKQKAIIARLKANGIGSGAAERLLRTMENALAALRFSRGQDPN